MLPTASCLLFYVATDETEQSLALRRQQIAASEEIIAGHVHDFSGWFVSARERMLNPAGLSEPSLRASES